MSAKRQRPRNALWGLLGGVVVGVIDQLVFRPGEMSVWVLVWAIAVAAMSGLFGPIRREPELYWSGLLQWCFTNRHAV